MTRFKGGGSGGGGGGGGGQHILSGLSPTALPSRYHCRHRNGHINKPHRASACSNGCSSTGVGTGLFSQLEHLRHYTCSSRHTSDILNYDSDNMDSFNATPSPITNNSLLIYHLHGTVALQLGLWAWLLLTSLQLLILQIITYVIHTKRNVADHRENYFHSIHLIRQLSKLVCTTL